MYPQVYHHSQQKVPASEDKRKHREVKNNHIDIILADTHFYDVNLACNTSVVHFCIFVFLSLNLCTFIFVSLHLSIFADFMIIIVILCIISCVWLSLNDVIAIISCAWLSLKNRLFHQLVAEYIDARAGSA